MEFRIADTFQQSLQRLSGEDQRATKTAAFDWQTNPATPGLLGLPAAVLLSPAVLRRLRHHDDAANVGDGNALGDQLLGGPLLRTSPSS